MKILIAACLLGTALSAGNFSPVERVVLLLERIDSCFAQVGQAASEHHIPIEKQSIMPTNALSRIQENCSASDLKLLEAKFSCLADSVCEWSENFTKALATAETQDPLVLLNQLSNMRECPKSEVKDSQ